MNKYGATLRILQLLQARKREGIFLIALVFVSTAFDIAVPFISKELIDRLIAFFKEGGMSPLSTLVWASGGILLATVLARVFRSAYDYHLFKRVTSWEDEIRKAVMDKYYALHVMFHHSSSSGQIIGRIERGTGAIFNILYEIFGQNLVPPLMVFLGVSVALFYQNPWVALAVFLPLPVYLISIKRLSEKIYKIELRVNEEFEAVSKESYDAASNILTVKKFSQESAETGHQMQLIQTARQTQYEAERLWGIMENIQTLITTIGRVGIIFLGGFFVLTGKSTVGEFVLYVTLQGMAYAPMMQLSNTLPRLRRNSARVERLFGVLDEPLLVVDKPGANTLPHHRKSIEFRDVSFQYNPKRWALKEVNVVIPAGSTVALVGHSGSGKTTFINLLLRSFDPNTGAILIDGTDLRDITRTSLLAQIAVVPQEVDLFSRSILENIAYGKPEVSRDAVAKAAEIALAHDFIMQTENGYDTLVGERGIKLSGGERQRIGIARAVLRDPKILILDEATSHLDTESERLIAKATDNLIKNRTTIIIAHRLSTILGADQILVFKDGKIESIGKHADLLEKSPTYKKLYTLQFSENKR